MISAIQFTPGMQNDNISFGYKGSNCSTSKAGQVRAMLNRTQPIGAGMKSMHERVGSSIMDNVGNAEKGKNLVMNTILHIRTSQSIKQGNPRSGTGALKTRHRQPR